MRFCFSRNVENMEQGRSFVVVVIVVDYTHFQLECTGISMILMLAGDRNAVRTKESKKEVIWEVLKYS